ncbi:phosphatidylinositol N-acetylglucosaminyltransferase [Cristinia sonorae]|uniref:Phosphatidylinositol N-acetylglucosaminyltransferase n=1 Tax=Cristinia sonorae TaxID=1940300 RepID=A0A8K0URV4_9AGAR|nr:phosphatidylinositol N-acetylglucosaminyltransferase [Cristinia sonorae]
MTAAEVRQGRDSEVQWERALWKRTTLPDNYVPDSFLSSLTNFRPYTYWHLVAASWAISQHLATIFTFVAVFVRLKERILDPRLLVWLSTICFMTGYAIWVAVKSSILVFLALLSLSPVLRTLTAATSSDSIWALSAGLFFLNAILADYTSMDPFDRGRQRLSSVLSVNAAISSSVVLASRLTDDISVFALSLFSVLSFAFFPMLRRRLQNGPKVVNAVLTVALLSLSLFLTSPLSNVVTWLYLMVFLAITFLAPAALVWSQRFKNELRGNWDAAVPKVNVDSSVH